jgi:hypothetical protein
MTRQLQDNPYGGQHSADAEGRHKAVLEGLSGLEADGQGNHVVPTQEGHESAVPVQDPLQILVHAGFNAPLIECE